MFVLYLSGEACHEATNEFKKTGIVMEVYRDLVEIYTLPGFEQAFNEDEKISDQGHVKFMDDHDVIKYYRNILERDYDDTGDAV